jgi:hypothetical protein
MPGCKKIPDKMKMLLLCQAQWFSLQRLLYSALMLVFPPRVPLVQQQLSQELARCPAAVINYESYGSLLLSSITITSTLGFAAFEPVLVLLRLLVATSSLSSSSSSDREAFSGLTSDSLNISKLVII